MLSLNLYLSLSKPRLCLLVIITASLSYIIAASGIPSILQFLSLITGLTLTSFGAASLNNYIERDYDLYMERTKTRVLPAGLLPPSRALAYGIITSLVGTVILVICNNLLTGFLALLTVFLYALVYTPLKRLTWLNTIVGAIPGALPMLGGWTAATNSIDPGAWVLFTIMFLWQMPHFYAIAWVCREQYKAAGFKMLPSIDEENGNRTFFQIIIFSVLLLIASIAPTVYGMTGALYLLTAISLGIVMILLAAVVTVHRTTRNAKRLFFYSIIYLPLLLGMLALDIILIKLGFVAAGSI